MSDWEMVDDDAELSAALQLLRKLEAVLDDEREAVVALNYQALPTFMLRKQALVNQLNELSARAAARREEISVLREDGGRARVRASVRELSEKIRSQAAANALLFSDAVRSVSSLIGLSTEAETYDAHARPREMPRTGTSRAA